MQNNSSRCVYGYKPGTRFKADAQIAGGVCEELMRTVGLTPRNLVEASRDESAPLHSEFEWDDTLAAEKYRETQAAHIIRSITVHIEHLESTRAFANVLVSSGLYEPIQTVISAPDKRARLIEQALADLRAFQTKYAALTELCDLFAAMDAAAAGLAASAI